MELKKLTKLNSINLYNKFLGFLIKKGNINSAKLLLEKILFLLVKKIKKSKKIIFLRLFLKLNIFVEVKKVKMRNRSHFVPFSLSLKRRSYLVIKWLLQTIKQNKENVSTSKKLYEEIFFILTKSKCKTLSLKINNNNEAFLNRSNVHYRW